MSRTVSRPGLVEATSSGSNTVDIGSRVTVIGYDENQRPTSDGERQSSRRRPDLSYQQNLTSETSRRKRGFTLDWHGQQHHQQQQDLDAAVKNQSCRDTSHLSGTEGLSLAHHLNTKPEDKCSFKGPFYGFTLKSSTWVSDSHGLYDYETHNVSAKTYRCHGRSEFPSI